MAGKALPNFADFVSATNERVATDPKTILNDAVLQMYGFKDMLKGKSAAQVVKSGSKLTDRIQLSVSDNAGFYDPNDTLSASISDTLTKIEVNWRFAKSYWAWTDHELELNEGDRLTQFKSLRDAKRQDCTVSLFSLLEQQLWATPDVTTMEATTATGGRPYSIRAFLTEDGLAPSGFTTLMTVNPSTSSNWRNPIRNYQAASLDTTLIGAMERLWKDLNFESPTTKEAAFTDTNFSKFRIYTNNDGWANYVRLTRSANDRAYAGNRPDLGYAVNDVIFNGIPVKGITQLDNVGYTTGQPRFFFLNSDFIYPVFHSQRYMWETDPINGGPAGQPFSWVVYKDLWYNLFCRSRKRGGGVVVPV